MKPKTQVPFTKKKLKILTFPTHEGYQSLLDQTGHEFYMITGPNLKGWDYHTRPLPPNHFLLKDSYQEGKLFEPIDLVLCQSRDFQYDLARTIADQHEIPMVQLEHTQPPLQANPKQLAHIQQRKSKNHVYITEFSKNAWGDNNGIVIPHGIPTDKFTGWTGTDLNGLSVVNHFPQRDMFCGWKIWQQIVCQVPVKLIGENPGFTQSAPTLEALISEMGKARFFLNTSQWSPVPLSMLEAMACGCPVVTTAKQEIPKIITNGVNGFVSNDIDELIKGCIALLEDQELAARMGQAARQTILEKFNMNQFINNWNNIFAKAIKDHR